MQVNQIQP